MIIIFVLQNNKKKIIHNIVKKDNIIKKVSSKDHSASMVTSGTG